MIGFCGGTTAMNQGRMFITLKPLGKRKLSADQVIQRLRQKLAVVPGATLYMQAQQDLTHRRPHEPGAISVHAAGRGSERAERLGAAVAARRCERFPNCST